MSKFTYEEIDLESCRKMVKDSSFKKGFVRILPYNQFLPRVYLDYAEEIQNFETKSDDIWIASFPKCGKNIQNYSPVIFCK